MLYLHSPSDFRNDRGRILMYAHKGYPISYIMETYCRVHCENVNGYKISDEISDQYQMYMTKDGISNAKAE